MAYIGRDISNLSDRVVLDNITASATATYNLLLNSVAFVPSSAESLTVSLNGVIQKPQGSYTVSGSTIVFDSALTSSDSIDFILAERAITLTTIGSGTVNTSNIVDDAVTTAKINDGAVTSAKLDSGLALGKIVGFKDVIIGSSDVATTSSSYSDVISTTYTPSSTSNYLYVEARVNYRFQGNSETSEPNGAFQIISPTTVRGSIYTMALHTANNKQSIGFGTFNAYWNPNTTSSVDVKLQIKNPGQGQFTAYGTSNGESITRPTAITIFEVSA